MSDVIFEDITLDKFQAYVDVQMSGETNMLDVIMVVHLSDDRLTTEEVSCIISNYSALLEKYPEVLK